MELAEYIRDNNGFVRFIMWYIEKNYRTNPDYILKIVERVNNNCAEVYRSYKDADSFAILAFHILSNSELGYVFELKANAADILKWAASDINRFDAQNFIQKLKRGGIEPLIEAIFEE